MKKVIIKRSNLPTRFPVKETLLIYLCLDYWNAPEWSFGAFYAVYGIIWIASIMIWWEEEEVDVLGVIHKLVKQQMPAEEPRKQTFYEKLEERMKNRYSVRDESRE